MPAPHIHFDNHEGFSSVPVYQQGTSLCAPEGMWVMGDRANRYARTFRCTLDWDKVTCPDCKALQPVTWKTLLYAALEAKYDLPKGSMVGIDETAHQCDICGTEYSTDLNYRVNGSLKYKTVDRSLSYILEEL